jgi:hypothetical protein
MTFMVGGGGRRLFLTCHVMKSIVIYESYDSELPHKKSLAFSFYSYFTHLPILFLAVRYPTPMDLSPLGKQNVPTHRQNNVFL